MASSSSVIDQQQLSQKQADALEAVSANDDTPVYGERRPLRKRILGIIWDTFDKSPEERKLVTKLDWWILSYCCISYFVKYLDQTNVSDERPLDSLQGTSRKIDSC